MKKLLCALALVCVAAVAVDFDAVTAPSPESPLNPGRAPRGLPTPNWLIGTVDTIGGTVYDWQANGPCYRMIATSPDYGVHALWMWSSDPNNYPDRNMRYNFYDFSTHSWNWVDPDFMQSGINTFSARSGYGRLAINPTSDVAVVSCHQGAIYPVLARDIAPGAGIFEYCSGQPNMDMYQWPVTDMTQSQTIHVHMIDNASQDQIYYSRGTSWCNWSSPIGVAAPQPDPTFPTHNVAASKVSNKVCLTWVFSDASSAVAPAFYRLSTDDGATWGAATEITTPDPFSGDTTPSFHITSLFPWYDSQDNLHYVANIMPVVRDTGYILPSVIMHWSQANGWTQIHRADTDTLLAAVGYNATLACRPTIAQAVDDPSRLFVAWEQFNGANVEPVTNLCRADIYYAQSTNGGQTWTAGVKITDRTTASCRFPCISDPVVNDTILILYEIDRMAGFYVQTQGNATLNPMVVHKLVSPTGVAEAPTTPVAVELGALANPVRGRSVISYALPRSAAVTLSVCDASGRTVATLVNGLRSAGRYSATWDAGSVAGGVYFCTLTADGKSITRKLTVTH
jgi:hypothetical protein